MQQNKNKDNNEVQCHCGRLCKGDRGLKSNSHFPNFFFLCFNESSLKMLKIAFHFNLKAPFVLKIFEFLSWHFGHVEETA